MNPKVEARNLIIRPVWSQGRAACAVLTGMILALALTELPETVFATPAGARFHDDRILIKPAPGVLPAELDDLHARLGNRVLRTFPRIGNWQIISLAHGRGVSNNLAAYEQSGLVQRAEPDYLVCAQVYPNDFHFFYGDQWNLINLGQYGGTPGADIHVTNAWSLQTSATNLIVAVTDTGIRYTHEDLAANLWHNPQENLDGYTNDLYGINLNNNGRGNGDPWDDNGHGTHVAGIIGAVGNNSVGIAGICWNAQLMSLKFIDSNGDGTISDAITCLDFAASHGARVVNASWGGLGFASDALFEEISNLNQAGIIFVTAAGNTGNNDDINLFYPAGYSQSLPNVIAVAATDRHDNMASWSNYGTNSVQVAAPGYPIYSCWNGSDSDYQNYQGTSMAAAHITGACALVWAHSTNLTAVQVVNSLLNGVDVLTNLTGLVGTGGRLNVFNAMSQSVAQSFSAGPRLSIQLASDTVQISWPSAVGSSWTLYCQQDVAPTDGWDSVTNPPALVGSNYVVTVSFTSASCFYRLQRH